MSGVVQGVGFRWYVREAARAHALHGWVRNDDNGDVVLEAAGAGDALHVLEAALRRGPPGARVTDVRREAPEADGVGGLPHPFAVHR